MGWDVGVLVVEEDWKTRLMMSPYMRVSACSPGVVHVAGLRTVGRLGVAADLNLEHVKRSTVVGEEQEVEDLALLVSGVGREVHARGATA